MSNFTVSDILGVGFKYVQTAEDQLTTVPTGTIAALFGTANWGPIGVPTLISSGDSLTAFMSTFGYGGTLEDEGWDAAYHHFQNSSVGYFTRIVSSANPPKRSYGEVVNNAITAFLTGTATLDSILKIYPDEASNDRANNTLSLVVKHQHPSVAIMTTPEDLTVNIDFQSGSSPLVSIGATLEGQYFSSGTFDNTKTISFKVYDEDGVAVNNENAFTFTANNNIVTGAQSFVDLLLTNSTIQIATQSHFKLTASGTKVYLTTEPFYYGEKAKIEIISNTMGIFSPTDSDNGADVSRTAAINFINDAYRNTVTTVNSGSTIGTLYGSNVTIASVSLNSKLVLTAPTSGTNSRISISANNTLFGFSSGASNSGVNGKIVGTFRAKQRGKEGNLITLIFSNTQSVTDRVCRVFFRNAQVAEIIGYSYDPVSVDFLPTIFKDSEILSSIIEYNHGKTFTIFDESDNALSVGTDIPNVTLADQIGDGIYSLNYGTSGDSNINVNLDLIPLVKLMSNEDIYDFDIIATPGYPEQSVQKALLDDICEYRKDCFTVLDMPDFGNPSVAIDRAINWINGKHISRTEKLNSIYGTVYFPWIKIKKKIYDSGMNLIDDTLKDYSPVSRVIAMISGNDRSSLTKVSAPAGVIKGVLTGVEGLKQYLSAAERDRLYADAYDNCINPIMFTTSSSSYFVNGQKTTLRKNARGNLTALSRINVMRTGLYIKKEVARIVPTFFHQPNDSRSRENFAALISDILNYLVSIRAIEDNFIVICNETNNPPEITNNNGLIAAIEFTPIKTIERIKLYANIKERRATVTVG